MQVLADSLTQGVLPKPTMGFVKNFKMLFHRSKSIDLALGAHCTLAMFLVVT